MDWKQSRQSYYKRGECSGRGSHGSSQSRAGRRPEWAEGSNGQRLRHIPTLAQAAKELEFALADLARDPHMQQRTLLVLDGPLQISRHNGDLIATRPAPLPPSTKPHSKSFKKSKSIRTKAKPVEDVISHRSGTLKAFRATKERPSPPLPDKDSKNKDEPAPKETKRPKTPKLQDETKRPSNSPTSSSNLSDEVSKGPKMKKSFTLTMPSFKRTNNPQAPALQKPGLSFTLSSRSESSRLDPLTPKARPDGPQRLSSSSDPSLDVDVDLDLDAGTASKREDLLLQLPRLQTHDLGFKDPFEPLRIEKELLAQIQTKHEEQQQGQPQSVQPKQKPMQGVAPSYCASGPTQQVQHQHSHPAQASSLSGDAKSSTLQLRIIPPEDEKMLVASEFVASERLRHMQAFVSTAQASSVQLPPEQIYELAAMPPSPSSSMPAMFIEMPMPHMPVDFPVEMPEHLVILIMERIDSLDDLFNLVLVNKRFYQIFKRRELSFIKGALFRMSPPAWELREMSPPWKDEWQLLLERDAPLPEYTPELYLDRYASDIYTLAQLKSMILVRCSPFLRRDTVKGLSGVDIVRAEEVDDAFWRIWTFCRIFGSGKGRENDLEGQMDWLKGGPKARSSFGASSTVTEPFDMNDVLFEPPEGFARGNSIAGLSAKQLYDITEIWTCLGVLLQPLHGQCVEARNAGIFQGLDIPEGDTVREETALGK
jgi:hypothetical protein